MSALKPAECIEVIRAGVGQGGKKMNLWQKTGRQEGEAVPL